MLMHRATSVYEPIPPDNSSSRRRSHSAVHGDGEAHSLSVEQADRDVLPDTEFLLSALRVATLRARLAANELDSIGVALKRGLVSYDDAMAWGFTMSICSTMSEVIPLTPLDNNALDRLAIRQDRPLVLFGDLSATSNKQWLVRELLGEGDASGVYGKPGDGKSVLVEDMALHTAAGRDWHRKQVRQGGVLYIALERKKLVERRAIAFRETYDLSSLPFAIMGGVHDFRVPRTAVRIGEIAKQVEEATETPLRLICIDTLSRALCGGDENASKDMGAIVNVTALLQQGTGRPCLLAAPHASGGRANARTGNLRTATVVKANDLRKAFRSPLAWNL